MARLSIALAAAALAVLLGTCTAIPETTRKLGASSFLAASVDVNPDAAPASSFTTDLAACGAEIAGWEKHTNTFPKGKWESYFADSASACTAACSANADRCVATLWEDAKVLPYSDDAKCRFVTELTGLVPGMPAGVDLYTPCKTGCGAEIAGYEVHANTLPRGVWESYFAGNAADCAAACTANAARPCVASIWEDAKDLPLSDDAKCQLVSSLTGYTPDMPDGINLYVAC
eukprot:TRINITY_DN930_c0_g3_i1.p1 TRINITY_DN930_c0_g3~~TRINITY_DN930_c0_g3_i1.p1  ORF type:complete len:231 (-),score=32.06 TRINITY_DN930_c0_g3_i1:762-1454(-)